MLENCHNMTKGVTNARQEQRHNEAKEEEKQRLKEEVNWLEYFQSIRSVCPWSLKAYMDNKILHVKNPNGCELSWCAAFSADTEPGTVRYEALLFEYDNDASVDTLYDITEVIDAKYPQLISFWSHPIEEQNNTPTPCVIVQDKGTLTDLRKKMGFENE